MIDVSFHNHGLVDVTLVNEDITTIHIYDNNNYALGTRLTLFFDSPAQIADWAQKILTTTLALQETNKPKRSIVSV